MLKGQYLYTLFLWLILPLLLICWGALYHFSNNEIPFEIGYLVAIIIVLQMLGLYFKYKMTFYTNYLFIFILFIIATIFKDSFVASLTYSGTHGNNGGEFFRAGLAGGLYGIFIANLCFWHRTKFLFNTQQNHKSMKLAALPFKKIINSIKIFFLSIPSKGIVLSSLIIVLGGGGIAYYYRYTDPFNQCIIQLEKEKNISYNNAIFEYNKNYERMLSRYKECQNRYKYGDDEYESSVRVFLNCQYPSEPKKPNKIDIMTQCSRILNYKK